MANPAVANGHIDIATELAERFAHTPLSGQEWRVLWVVIRKTWGWKDGNRKKDFDRISISQFEEGTSMKHSNVVETIQKLVVKRLLLKKGDGYGMNQNYDEWVVVKRLPPKKKAQVVVKSPHPSSQLTTNTSSQTTTKSSSQLTTHNRYKDKKDIIQKIEPRKKMTDDELERRCKKLVVEQQWCDEAYAEKTWKQGLELRGEHREQFLKKARIMLSWSYAQLTIEKARLLHHEMAGFVNDKGAMERQLTGAELQARQEFSEGMDHKPEKEHLPW